MYKVKRLLVGLDLSEMDQKLISYTSFLADLFQVEMIYFLHVAKSLKASKSFLEKYPDLAGPVDEAFEKNILDRIDKNFTANCPYDVEVREGNAEDTLLRWAELKKIDLAVMGRKQQHKGTGLLPARLARTIHCSILQVPETATNKISRIMVPVDFSKASSMAFDEAMVIKKATGAHLILHHAYEVPSGYHMSGKSYEEFAEIMKGNSYEDAVTFIKNSQVTVSEVEIIVTLDEDEDPAKKACDLAETNQIDLIVIGSKGLKEIASILLGSVADKMLHYDKNIPLMVVKDKKQNLNILQALLKL